MKLHFLRLLTLVATFTGAPLFAQFSITSGTGDYNNPAIWNPTGVPSGTGTYVLITGSNTVTFQTGDAYTVGAVGIGHSSANAGPGTLTMTGGTFTTSGGIGDGAFNIGESRGALFNQSGGTLNVSGALTLGYYYTSGSETMVWNFSGGTATVNGNVEIGRFQQGEVGAAHASINQTGGSNLTVNGNLMIGASDGDSSDHFNVGKKTFSHTLAGDAQLSVTGVIQGNTYGTRVFTFDGGTLSSSTQHNTGDGFISNLDHVYVETGGARINTSGGHLLIASNLEHAGAGTDGGLIKTGLNTLTLTGTNTYNGATIIAAGSLLVDGSLADTTVTVADGATLGGLGTIGGATTIAGGGRLAPGSSTGTLTFTNSLTLTAGAILDFQLGSKGDLIVVSGGTLTSNTGVILNLSDAGGFAAGNYTLFDFSTGSTDATNFDAAHFTFGSTPSGYTYLLAITGNTLQLTATASAIPEPSTYAALLGIGAIGFAAWRRQRQRQS